MLLNQFFFRSAFPLPLQQRCREQRVKEMARRYPIIDQSLKIICFYCFRFINDFLICWIHQRNRIKSNRIANDLNSNPHLKIANFANRIESEAISVKFNIFRFRFFTFWFDLNFFSPPLKRISLNLRLTCLALQSFV